MIPKLYDKNNVYIGDLTECSRAIVIEERNGMFELEIDYQLTSPYSDSLIRGNIITVDANDELKNQMFRIYKVTKNILGRFTVYCRHISYDIARDRTEGLEITNQSCEYCLNMLFTNSYFSQKFTGYSDIVNAQNYTINATNLLTAIVGERGSIIDTFGTGAEILRDNYDFYVLNKRGKDNDVVIEYASNMTGLDYEEDEEGLITRIRAIAKYNDDEGNEQIISAYITSDKVSNYETPFISEIDFSQDFEEGEIPTIDKLTTLAQKYFTDNKCDEIKYNYKVQFVPLSKCAGYEDIEDKIELCDTVGIVDYRYNLNTKAKVIRTTYDVLKERYESMELGEPRSSLGDIVGGAESSKGEKGDKGDKGDKGEDGSIGDFPDSLPETPIVTTKVYGFANIEISWTFENKVYYQYEVYASKEADFIPNTFNLIHSGQTSTYLFQANPNETWHFKVCAINTHGNRTNFGYTYATTAKVDDLSNYVSDMAIDDALIGTLSLDRGWVGTLKGNHIDAKNLSVTDGNGKRTLDIDSYGNVSLDVASLKISSSNVATENYADTKATQALNDSKLYTTTEVDKANSKIATIEIGLDGIVQRVSSTESTTSTLSNKVDSLQMGGTNLWVLSDLQAGYESSGSITGSTACHQTRKTIIDISDCTSIVYQVWNPNKVVNSSNTNRIGFFDSSKTYISSEQIPALNGTTYQTATITKPTNAMYARLGAITGASSQDTDIKIKFEKGNKPTDWTPAPEDVQSQIDTHNNNIASLTTRMNTAESKITDSAIINTVSSTIDSKVNTGINNIQVGGRNFVTNSNKFNAGVGANGISATVGSDGVLAVTASSGNGNWYTVWDRADVTHIENSFNEGDEVTISFTMKSPTGTKIPDIYFKYGMGYLAMSGNISANYSTVYCTTTWKKANSLNFHLGFQNAIGTYYIKDWKIEKGNKATDWTPAPEDVSSEITSKINTAKSEIKQTTDSIQSTVTNINNNYASKSQLTQTVNDFEYKFQQSKANLLYNSSGKSSELNPWLHFTYENGDGSSAYVNNNEWTGYETAFCIRQNTVYSSTNLGILQKVSVTPNRPHTLIVYVAGHRCAMNVGITSSDNSSWVIQSENLGETNAGTDLNNWHKVTLHFTPTEPYIHVRITMTNSNVGNAFVWAKRAMLVEGTVSDIEWSPNPSEVMNNVTNISSEGVKVSYTDGNYCLMNADGVKIMHSDGSYSLMNGDGFLRYINSSGHKYRSLFVTGRIQLSGIRNETVNVTLPDEFNSCAQEDLSSFAFITHTGYMASTDRLVDLYASANAWSRSGTNWKLQITAHVRYNNSYNSWQGVDGYSDTAYVRYVVLA